MGDTFIPFADLTLWLLTILAEFFVVYLFVIHHLFRRFLFLNTFLLLSATSGICRFAVLSHYGQSSDEYMYAYFASDALGIVFFLLSVCEAGVRAVGTRTPRKMTVLWGSSVLLATACFTVITDPFLFSSSSLITRFLMDFTTNAFYASFLVCAFFCVWHSRKDSQERMATRLVWVLSVYTSLLLFVDLGFQYVPKDCNFSYLSPNMIAACFPLVCGFTLFSHGQS